MNKCALAEPGRNGEHWPELYVSRKFQRN